MLFYRLKTTDFLLPDGFMPARWLETLRRVWNEALGLLYWRQYWLRAQSCGQTEPFALELTKATVLSWDLVADKEAPQRGEGDPDKKQETDDWVLCCAIGRTYRRTESKSWDAKNLVWKPFRWSKTDAGHFCCPVDGEHESAGWSQTEEGVFYCDLDAVRAPVSWDHYWVKPLWLETPLISDYSVVNLRKPFAQKRCDWLGDIPQFYVNDFLEGLAESWSRYTKGNGGRPHFKSKKKSDRVNSIPCRSLRSAGKLTPDLFVVPGLKIVRSVEQLEDYPTAVVDPIFLDSLQARLLTPLASLKASVRDNLESFTPLQERLSEGERFQSVLELLESGEPLPDVSFPLSAEIKEARQHLDTMIQADAIAKLQKRLLKVKPDKAERLQQVLELLQRGSPLPEPHPLRAEVLKAQKLLEQKPLESVLSTFKSRVSDRQPAASLEHLTAPGSFHLCRIDGKDYFKVTHYTTQHAPPSDRSVGIDVGLDYLYTTTTGVKVKHANYDAEAKRLASLQQKLATKQVGSANWQQLQDKINCITGRVKRSKKKRQDYHSSWQTDSNGNLAVKHFKPKQAVKVPKPLPSANGDRYLANGRGKNKEENRVIKDAALGQFVSLLQQKAESKGRQFEKVEVAVEAPATKVLDLSTLPPNVLQPATPAAVIVQILETALWESVRIVSGTLAGKETPPQSLPRRRRQTKEAVETPPAKTPKTPPFKTRNRKRERAIG